MAALAETKFRAFDIDCPVCHVEQEKPCRDEQGKYRAPHVERGRTNRWAKMGIES